MRVMISGSSGFVGRHFMARLREHDLVGIDIVAPALSRVEFRDDLREFVKYRSPDEFDLVIHCAAVVGGRVQIDGDPLAIAANLAIDSDLFRWLVKGKNKKRVVYFSSSAVYPTMLQTQNTHCDLAEQLVNLDGDRVGMPDQTYGFAKLAGEYLAKQAVNKYGVEVVIYRPFSGYGEDQALDYPFPSIIQRVANRDDPLLVWGSGNQVRDFIHIDDVVEAVMTTYDKLEPGSVLNLGTGIGTSFIELAEAAADTAEYDPEIVTDPTKPAGVFSRVADSYALRDWYAPRITLDEGIERALHAHKKRLTKAG